MNFYLHHLGDYAKDTKDLSMLEHAAYRLLLDHNYATELPIPNEFDKLYRIAGARTPAELKAVQSVAEKFFPVNGDGRRHNKRAEEEIVRAQEKSAKAKISAAASVKARFGSDAPVAPARAERDVEWSALVYACGSKCVRCGATDRPLERDHIVPTYQGGADTIENWQPICQPCNGSKGPETIDHRPPGWRSAFAERTLNARRASQEPKPEEAKTSVAAQRKAATTSQPHDCPHEKLISLYHALLPDCTKLEKLTPARRALIRARWIDESKPNREKHAGYTTTEDGLDYWRRFFGWCAQSEFLTGRAAGRNGGAPFVASLPWLLKAENFAKAIEGTYHR